MALKFPDGFSLYGTGATGRTNMLQGLYSEVTASNMLPSVANPYGLGTHHMRTTGVNNNRVVLRRNMAESSLSVFGVGCAHYFTALPNQNGKVMPLQILNAANEPQLTVTLTSAGQLELRSGDHAGSIVATSSAIVTAGAYQHLEMAFNVSTGGYEFRRNGVTVLAGTGAALGSGLIQLAIGTSNITGTGGFDVNNPWDFTNLHVWDDSGVECNDFLGDVQWLARVPTADTAQADWSGTYDSLNEVPPNGDGDYIEADMPGDLSAFEFADVPANTSDIIAVAMQPMARKTDAGDCHIRAGLMADAGSPNSILGAAHAITETYTYYLDVLHTNPVTGVAWTPAEINAAKMQFYKEL